MKKTIKTETSDDLSTKTDLKDLEIRMINKMQLNTWTIVVAMGIFGLLNHWLFK